MSAIFRKHNGQIEVMVVEDGAPVLLSRCFRISNGFRVDIAHWLDPANMTAYIALRNPCLQMLDNLNYDDQFGLDSDVDADAPESAYVRYEGVVLMRMPDLNYEESPRPFLTDLDGRILSGSNVYNSGHLCLGNSFNPLTIQPAELLLNNSANQDLGWIGGHLEGSWKHDNDSYFLISSWPSQSRKFTPPPAILADIRRWWPT
jgi:hypothetical protein